MNLLSWVEPAQEAPPLLQRVWEWVNGLSVPVKLC